MPATTASPYAPGYLIAGKYELEAQLGQGGMGVVWRARNVALDSQVAIKVVRATNDKALLRGRLVQEAKAAAKLTHPAIVKVFDVGQTESGDPFIVMELLQGDSLGQILEVQGRLPSVQAVRSLLPIVDALWLAHGKGIVHRDLKPDNVFIVQHEGAIQPKLVDFGIVKVQGAAVESHLTKSGDVLGSPDYMSPEQARGEDDITHLTDVWSLCVVLYEAVAGRTPFKGANYNALLRQIVEDAPPTLRELAAGDEQLSAIVARGLSKNAGERFASMGELGRALAEWLLAQGVNEDICGSTLEARWLRSSDPHTRAGRASMVSLTDAWPNESGSGVRRSDVLPVHTLPAPPLEASSAPPSRLAAVEGSTYSEAALALEQRPAARPKWVVFAAAFALLALALAGFGLGKSLLSAPIAPTSAAAQKDPVISVPEAASAPPLPPAIASGVPGPSASVDEKRAQPVREQVSSPLASPKGVAKRPRPAALPPKKGTPTSGKAKAKPGDLISPY